MDHDMEGIDTRKEESEEEDDEEADENFNPDKADGEDQDNSSSSSDEDEDEAEAEAAAATKAAKKTSRKRKSQAPAVSDELDSGDEATINERKRKKRKKDAGHGEGEEHEESGGEGGFIRTRAQRLVEKEERKNRKRGAREGAVTIDVNTIWAELSSIPIGRVVVAPPKPDSADDMAIDDDNEQQDKEYGEMITIQTWANFAGQLTAIEKEVPRNSKEAQEYLKKQRSTTTDPTKPSSTSSSDRVHRPLTRPSMFEPNPLGAIKGVPAEKLRSRAPSRMDILMAARRAELEAANKSAGKLSTVQMSQYDWKKYVQKEGYEEELEKYKKSDVRFLEREAFLDRAAGAREQAARDARLKL